MELTLSIQTMEDPSTGSNILKQAEGSSARAELIRNLTIVFGSGGCKPREIKSCFD